MVQKNPALGRNKWYSLRITKLKYRDTSASSILYEDGECEALARFRKEITALVSWGSTWQWQNYRYIQPSQSPSIKLSSIQISWCLFPRISAQIRPQMTQRRFSLRPSWCGVVSVAGAESGAEGNQSRLCLTECHVFSDGSHFRGEFLKQQCPVSTCVLTSNRNKFQTADLVLFKVTEIHFWLRQELRKWILHSIFIILAQIFKLSFNSRLLALF